MAYANSRFGYQHTQPESAISSRRPSGFDEEDGGVLDSAILDADLMQSPADAHLRKGSFANSNGILSPTDTHVWDHQYTHGLAGEPNSAGPSNAFHEEHNGFVRHHHPTPISTYSQPHHAQSWSVEAASGHCTPTGAIDFAPAPPPSFEGTQGPIYGLNRVDSARGSFSHPGQHAPLPHHFYVPHPEGPFIQAPQVHTPVSPHSHQQWMAMAQQEVESRPVSRRTRASSPPRTSVDLQRRSGIRKKNSRIEIPTERSIDTIDDLIEKTQDENLLKELKQQKRLLRNREAALASRQRKKKHTETLEMREKSFDNTVRTLEEQLQTLHIEHEHLSRDHHRLIQDYARVQRNIHIMEDEQKEAALRHNDETSQLRRQIQSYKQRLDAGPAPLMSAVPSSTGFTEFNEEMEALNMGSQDWDHFLDMNNFESDSQNDLLFDFKPEAITPSSTLEKRNSSSTVVAHQTNKSPETASDQPIASGLLFFLLLCGAFVASKPASSRSTDLPDVPEDVRAAAPAVLDNLLSEQGASPVGFRSRHAPTRPATEPSPSGVNHGTKSRTGLDQLHHRLTSPTQQQEEDAAFSLTTAQWASITNVNFHGQGERPGPSQQHEARSNPRRNLAETLANMQEEHVRNSKAAVYTRSLLWEQIPADVVKQFKELVRDHDELERQERQLQYDDMFVPKVEQ